MKFHIFMTTYNLTYLEGGGRLHFQHSAFGSGADTGVLQNIAAAGFVIQDITVAAFCKEP